MKILLLISILMTHIYAIDTLETSERVLITKTSTKSKLPLIKKELDRLKVKMFVQTIPSGHYVYSKIFTSKRSAQYNLRKIRTRFPNAKLVVIDNKNNDENDKYSYTQNKNSYENSFFIRLGLTSSSVSGSTNISGASSMENSSLGYSIEPGYIYNKNLFFSGAYMDNSTDDISILNLYATANYNYNLLDGLGLYIGGILGYSELELTGYSLSTPSKSLLYGIQLGARYSMFDYLSIFTTYQLFMLDHSIKMEDTGSNIKLDSLDNFMLGVGYEF